MAYKCNTCGATSEEAGEHCGAPMEEVSQSDAPESTDTPAE